jgi:uncharacterized protein YdaU (DUF1376 family)
MVNWYKHDIPSWMDGTESLSDSAYRAYHVICQLIYLNEGSIMLNEHGIAGRCRQSIRAFRASLRELLDTGKLTLSEGRLSNSRAKKELEKVYDNRLNASKGGQKSSKHHSSADNVLNINSLIEASLKDGVSLKEKTREEKKEESCTVAKATRTKNAYSEDFEKFWDAYPRTPTMSKQEAAKSWSKLPEADRLNAFLAIDPYKKFLASKPSIETVHACRFLSQRRFDGLLQPSIASTSAFNIRNHLV